jgi:hypothetical protein
MDTTLHTSEIIVNLLRERKIATMPELVAALGTVERTVFRKLKELSYHTSYSHSGRYYTLDEVVDFDPLGLWSYMFVGFSVHGTLLATVEAMVKHGDRGYFVDELDSILHVATKDVLRKLAVDGRLTREKVGERYLYCSFEPSDRNQQLLARKTQLAKPNVDSPLQAADVMPDELKAAIILFYSLLDEKLQRLFAGLESLKLGHGGDTRIADLLGLDPGTVARGRGQLLSRDIEVDRIRRAGAGRPALEKKRPR